MIIMKRLFILSAAVAALASCSNSEVITEVNEPQVPDKAIAFETFSSNATRAEGDPKSENSGQSVTNTDGLEEHHVTFKVWGYKDVQSTGYVFNGTEVKYEITSTGLTTYAWQYSPVHFWDKNANSYEFYASAPGTAGFVLNKNNENKQDDDYFTLSDVTLYNTTLASTTYNQSMKSGQAKNTISSTGETTAENNPTDINTDYMIANACKVGSSDFGSAVQLHFNHILSRLNITVKKGTQLQNAGATLDVVSLQVFNMVSKGSFDENKADNTNSVLANGTTTRWTTESDKVNYVANALNGVENNTAQYILQSLVLPQEVEYEEITLDGKSGGTSVGTTNKPYIKIVYKITTTASGQADVTETYTAYYNLAAVFGANSTTNVAFNEGWQNTLNITIDAAQITFDPDVYRWKDTDSSGSIEIGKVTQNS